MDEFWATLYANNLASEIANQNRIDLDYHINSKLSRQIVSKNMMLSRSILLNRDLLKVTQTSEKSYPNARFIPLAQPAALRIPLDDALRRRRSQLGNAPKIIETQQISRLLWAANGTVSDDRFHRTAPSGGALYPCEIYLISLTTELGRGIFHYRPKEHGLELLTTSIDETCLFVPGTDPHNAGILLVLSATFDKSFFKYGERSYRFILLEAGAIAQNVALAGVEVGVGVLPHGGYADVEVERQIGINGIDESVVHLLAIGSIPEKEEDH